MFRACCLNRSICCFSSTYRWRKTSSASRSLSGGDPRKPRHHPDQSSPNAIPFSLNQKPFSHSSKTQPECSRTLFLHHAGLDHSPLPWAPYRRKPSLPHDRTRLSHDSSVFYNCFSFIMRTSSSKE